MRTATHNKLFCTRTKGSNLFCGSFDHECAKLFCCQISSLSSNMLYSVVMLSKLFWKGSFGRAGLNWWGCLPGGHVKAGNLVSQMVGLLIYCSLLLWKSRNTNSPCCFFFSQHCCLFLFFFFSNLCILFLLCSIAINGWCNAIWEIFCQAFGTFPQDSIHKNNLLAWSFLFLNTAVVLTLHFPSKIFCQAISTFHQ